MQFLQHNWRNRSDIDDLRQDVYVRVYEAAQKQIPGTGQAVRVHHRAQSAHRSRAQRAGRSHRSGGRSRCAGHRHRCAGPGAQRRSRAMNCAACRPRSTAFRRAAAKPSSCAASKGFRAARSQRAWASSEDTVSEHLDQRHARARRHSLWRARRSVEDAMSEAVSSERAPRRSKRAPPRGCERRDSADWSGDDQAALDAWLAQSPAHRVAYCAAECGVGAHRAAGGACARRAEQSAPRVTRRVRCCCSIAAVFAHCRGARRRGGAIISCSRASAPIPRPSAGAKS